MSSRLHLPRCRKFPPRVSQEDLKAKTTAVMKEKGANYHFQAQYYEAASKEVVGSTNPKFTTLQPTIKLNNDKTPWAYSYDFVFDFLKKNNMELTLSTINVELGKKNSRLLTGKSNLFNEEDRDQYFSELNHISEQLNYRSFAKEVNEFAQEEGISD